MNADWDSKNCMTERLNNEATQKVPTQQNWMSNSQAFKHAITHPSTHQFIAGISEYNVVSVVARSGSERYGGKSLAFVIGRFVCYYIRCFGKVFIPLILFHIWTQLYISIYFSANLFKRPPQSSAQF
ncbi:hypothetical protein ILYODFUR_026947 [Ilyodon furcidens]|uniref:Uncharacterized protein n=1 Tax=Ilyodon furcidens TaxID=33524 RepID=A0ABV0TY03_9TELE